MSAKFCGNNYPPQSTKWTPFHCFTPYDMKTCTTCFHWTFIYLVNSQKPTWGIERYQLSWNTDPLTMYQKYCPWNRGNQKVHIFVHTQSKIKKLDIRYQNAQFVHMYMSILTHWKVEEKQQTRTSDQLQTKSREMWNSQSDLLSMLHHKFVNTTKVPFFKHIGRSWR